MTAQIQPGQRSQNYSNKRTTLNAQNISHYIKLYIIDKTSYTHTYMNKYSVWAGDPLMDEETLANDSSYNPRRHLKRKSSQFKSTTVDLIQANFSMMNSNQPMKNGYMEIEDKFDDYEPVRDGQHTPPQIKPINITTAGTSEEDEHILLTPGDNDPSNYDNPYEGTGTIFSSVLNFTNSIVGAGVIGLPFALAQAGLWLGIILLGLLTVIVDWTVRLLVTTSKLASRHNYQDLMEFAFGKAGLITISIFQFAFAFGAMCAYTVILGDTATPVLRQFFGSDPGPLLSILLSRRFITAFFTLSVSFPLSLYRDINKLSKTSAIAISALIIIYIAMLIEGPQELPENRGKVELSFANSEFLQSIGVISFAFVCHHNSFLIFGSMKTPTLDRWRTVTHMSTFLSFFFSLLMALTGYFIFGTKTQANILNNFSHDNVFINIARLLFALNMFTTYPLECFVCREVIEHYFYRGQEISNKLHFIITSCLTLVTLLIALVTCNLGIVLELTGCFSATGLAFILPPAMYLKLASGKVFSWKKLAPVACIVFGVIVMFTSTILSIYEVVSGEGHDVKECGW